MNRPPLSVLRPVGGVDQAPGRDGRFSCGVCHRTKEPLAVSLRLDTGGSAVKSSGVFRPHRLVAQDVGFSARKPGFDSPWGYSGPVSDHEAVQPASAGCTAFFTRSGRSPRGIEVRFSPRSWLQRRELHRHRFFVGSTPFFGLHLERVTSTFMLGGVLLRRQIRMASGDSAVHSHRAGDRVASRCHRGCSGACSLRRCHRSRRVFPVDLIGLSFPRQPFLP